MGRESCFCLESRFWLCYTAGKSLVLQTWSPGIAMMSPLSTDRPPLHRGAPLALWCFVLILPYMGCNSSQNKVGRGVYSHWIAQGGAGSVGWRRWGQNACIMNKRMRERKGIRMQDLGLPGVCFPNQASGLPICALMLCVFTFEIFSAFLAWVMEESTLSGWRTMESLFLN